MGKVSMRTRTALLACLSGLAVLLGSSVGAAQAREDAAAIVVAATSAPASQTTTSTVDCVQGDGTTGSCKATMSVDVSAATRASLVQIESDPNLTLAQRSQMVASGTITFYYRTFSHTVSSWYGGWAWSEGHSGGYYYNGSKVWLAVANYGYKGWHQCNYGSGFGYSIKVTFCGERQRPDLGTNVIAEYDNFEVHAVAKGIPIYDSKSMWVNLYPSGVGYYHWMN